MREGVNEGGPFTFALEVYLYTCRCTPGYISVEHEEVFVPLFKDEMTFMLPLLSYN